MQLGKIHFEFEKYILHLKKYILHSEKYSLQLGKIHFAIRKIHFVIRKIHFARRIQTDSARDEFFWENFFFFEASSLFFYTYYLHEKHVRNHSPHPKKYSMAKNPFFRIFSFHVGQLVLLKK